MQLYKHCLLPFLGTPADDDAYGSLCHAGTLWDAEQHKCVLSSPPSSFCDPASTQWKDGKCVSSPAAVDASTFCADGTVMNASSGKCEVDASRYVEHVDPSSFCDLASTHWQDGRCVSLSVPSPSSVDPSSFCDFASTRVKDGKCVSLSVPSPSAVDPSTLCADGTVLNASSGKCEVDASRYLENVDCQGEWSSMDTKTCALRQEGLQQISTLQAKQRYTITVPAQGNGAACPFADGDERDDGTLPVDCPLDKYCDPGSRTNECSNASYPLGVYVLKHEEYKCLLKYSEFGSCAALGIGANVGVGNAAMCSSGYEKEGKCKLAPEGHTVGAGNGLKCESNVEIDGKCSYHPIGFSVNVGLDPKECVSNYAIYEDWKITCAAAPDGHLVRVGHTGEGCASGAADPSTGRCVAASGAGSASPS